MECCWRGGGVVGDEHVSALRQGRDGQRAKGGGGGVERREGGRAGGFGLEAVVLAVRGESAAGRGGVVCKIRRVEYMPTSRGRGERGGREPQAFMRIESMKIWLSKFTRWRREQ